MPSFSTVLEAFAGTGSLSGSWVSPAGTDAGTVTRSSDQATSSTSNSSAIYTALGSVSDCEVFATCPVVSGVAGNWHQLIARASASDNGTTNAYYLRVDPDNTLWTIRKRVGGSSSVSVASATHGFTAGDKLGFEVIGSSLAGYRYTSGSWSQVLSVTDASIPTAGLIGFTFSDDTQTVRFDDFGGASVATTTSHNMLLMGVG